MSTNATRTTTVTFTGDVDDVSYFEATLNTNSPATSIITTLALGNNTITKPTGGSTSVALTIVPPSGNTNLITLKGVNGDTGIPLHLTDPTVIALDSTFSSLVLNAAAQIVGLRLQWN